ncbi:universal stress protein [Salegentibacter chungangensis]|uniref:Universal stress protein n=1 Tax=Salegentibacter chungangensis TaxID=1335724 RepID=A0ABW3NLY4_9FLAO
MNVLILTDFSKVAHNAASYALRFLENVPASFFLLNIETLNFKGEAEDYAKEKKGLALEKLEQEIDNLKKLTPNKKHTFQAYFSEENLVNSTRRYVHEKKIDLIVMGAAGREYPQNAILGHHTYEIIRKIRCNLLAVSEGSEYSKPEKLVLPIDYSASFEDKIFRFFDNPAIVKEAKITVLELTGSVKKPIPVETPRDMMANQLSPGKVKFMEVDESAICNEELLLEMQRKFNMIVILGKNLSVCDRLLHSRYGVCTAISNKLPVLVLHG